MTNFGPKQCTNPFGKILILSTFQTSCFYNVESCFFVLQSGTKVVDTLV